MPNLDNRINNLMYCKEDPDFGWHDVRLEDEYLDNPRGVGTLIGRCDRLMNALAVVPYQGNVTDPCPVISSCIIREFLDSDWSAATWEMPRVPKWPPPEEPATWDCVLLGVYHSYYFRVQLQMLVEKCMSYDKEKRNGTSPAAVKLRQIIDEKVQLVNYWNNCHSGALHSKFEGGPDNFKRKVKVTGERWYWVLLGAAKATGDLKLTRWLNKEHAIKEGVIIDLSARSYDI